MNKQRARASDPLRWAAIGLYLVGMLLFVIVVSLGLFEFLWIVLAAVLGAVGLTITFEYRWRHSHDR